MAQSRDLGTQKGGWYEKVKRMQQPGLHQVLAMGTMVPGHRSDSLGDCLNKQGCEERGHDQVARVFH